jgi:hypothetical protein
MKKSSPLSSWAPERIHKTTPNMKRQKYEKRAKLKRKNCFKKGRKRTGKGKRKRRSKYWQI